MSSIFTYPFSKGSDTEYKERLRPSDSEKETDEEEDSEEGETDGTTEEEEEVGDLVGGGTKKGNGRAKILRMIKG